MLMAMGYSQDSGETLVTDEETIDGRIVHRTFPVAGKTDFRTYPYSDTKYYLLEGEGTIVLPLEFSERVLVEGSFALIRAGVQHQIEGGHMLLRAVYEPPLDTETAIHVTPPNLLLP